MNYQYTVALRNICHYNVKVRYKSIRIYIHKYSEFLVLYPPSMVLVEILRKNIKMPSILVPFTTHI